MADPFASALPAFFNGPGAEVVTFVPRDGDPVPGIKAIRYNEPTDVGFSGGKTMAVRFELQRADVPEMPDVEDRITATDGDWFVQSAEPSLYAPAWLVTVEQTGRS